MPNLTICSPFPLLVNFRTHWDSSSCVRSLERTDSLVRSLRHSANALPAQAATGSGRRRPIIGANRCVGSAGFSLPFSWPAGSPRNFHLWSHPSDHPRPISGVEHRTAGNVPNGLFPGRNPSPSGSTPHGWLPFSLLFPWPGCRRSLADHCVTNPARSPHPQQPPSRLVCRQEIPRIAFARSPCGPRP